MILWWLGFVVRAGADIEKTFVVGKPSCAEIDSVCGSCEGGDASQ